MKKIVLSLLFLIMLLIPSCSKEVKTIVLVSPEGAVSYSEGRSFSKIIFSQELVKDLSKDSDTEEVFQTIFPDGKIYEVSGSEWNERKRIEAAFLPFTETTTIEEAYYKEKKSLKKSDYFKNIEAITHGFDRELFNMEEKNSGNFTLYEADNVIEIDSEKDKIGFLKMWIKAIVS